MIDNSQDKGYTLIYGKEGETGMYLCDITNTLLDSGDGVPLYIDYEAGEIFMDWGDDSPKETIAYYDWQLDEYGFANVYDNTKSRIIGRVGSEIISFRKRDADISANRYKPEEETLAFYNKSGSITKTSLPLSMVGLINGSEIGGAAAFVAAFYRFKIQSVFYDFFLMEYPQFQGKYYTYLHPSYFEES